jgi:hypothetical protein
MAEAMDFGAGECRVRNVRHVQTITIRVDTANCGTSRKTSGLDESAEVLETDSYWRRILEAR